MYNTQSRISLGLPTDGELVGKMEAARGLAKIDVVDLPTKEIIRGLREGALSLGLVNSVYLDRKNVGDPVPIKELPNADPDTLRDLCLVIREEDRTLMDRALRRPQDERAMPSRRVLLEAGAVSLDQGVILNEDIFLALSGIIKRTGQRLEMLETEDPIEALNCDSLGNTMGAVTNVGNREYDRLKAEGLQVYGPSLRSTRPVLAGRDFLKREACYGTPLQELTEACDLNDLDENRWYRDNWLKQLDKQVREGTALVPAVKWPGAIAADASRVRYNWVPDDSSGKILCGTMCVFTTEEEINGSELSSDAKAALVGRLRFFKGRGAEYSARMGNAKFSESIGLDLSKPFVIARFPFTDGFDPTRKPFETSTNYMSYSGESCGAYRH